MFSTQAINDAIAQLKLCRDVLDDDSCEIEHLDGALEAVNSAIEELAAIEEKICLEPGVEPDTDPERDAELIWWLLGNLQALRDVLTTAKILGLKAAKVRMYALAGRVNWEPRPEPKTPTGKAWVNRLRELLGVVAEAVHLSDKMIEVGKKIGLLTD